MGHPEARSTRTDVPAAQALRRLSPLLWPRAQYLRAMVLLDLPAQLANGPRTVSELARSIRVDEQMLGRFLRAAAIAGLVTGGDDGRYRASKVTSLLDSHDGAMQGYVLSVTQPSYTRPWERLADVVRTGQSAAAEVLGAELWTYREQHPDEGREFSQTMTDITVDTAAALTAGYDFTGVATVIDVGGSRGTLLAHVLRAVPGSTGIVYDLPGLRDAAEQELRAWGCADRARFEPGDFLTRVPPGGDLYLLKNVLCDWDDPHCRRILRNCFDAARPGSRLLVIDLIMPDSPSFLCLNDLEQAVATGGAVRTWPGYQELLAGAGYRHPAVGSVRRRDGLEHHLIEAHRP